GIEEVQAVVVAPVDRRVVGNAALGEEAARAVELVPLDPEGVVALAERMLDERRIGRGAPALLEQGAVAVAVAEEPLVGQPHHHAHAEHLGVEALRAVEVGDVHAEVIEAPDADHRARPHPCARTCRAISARVATHTRGVWRTWSISSARQASRDGRPMICGWNVKLVRPWAAVMPSNSVSQLCSTGPGGCIARWPVNRKNGASSSTHDTGISTRARPASAGWRYGARRSIMFDE